MFKIFKPNDQVKTASKKSDQIKASPSANNTNTQLANQPKYDFKIGIVGCGNVGMTTAYALLLKGIPTELVLISRSKDRISGEDLDLEHGMPFMERANVIGTDNYAQLQHSDLVIVSAGAAQKPGESRLDLTAKNLAITSEIVPQILENAPDAVILMVSNPVDVLTYHANQISQVRPGQIFGSGTLLDTARFRFHLSEYLNLNSRSIHAYVLGEHGDTSFPVLESATVGGQPLMSLPGFSYDKAIAAYEKAREAAYRIIQSKGATYYGIATVLAQIAQAIKRDSRSVMPLSVPLQNYHNQSDVSLSVPCIIGRRGVERTLEIAFSEEEKKKFVHSAETVRQAYRP